MRVYLCQEAGEGDPRLSKLVPWKGVSLPFHTPFPPFSTWLRPGKLTHEGHTEDPVPCGLPYGLAYGDPTISGMEKGEVGVFGLLAPFPQGHLELCPLPQLQVFAPPKVSPLNDSPFWFRNCSLPLSPPA